MQLHQQNPNQGYDGEALHISERARARSLLELLTEATANIRQGVARGAIGDVEFCRYAIALLLGCFYRAG